MSAVLLNPLVAAVWAGSILGWCVELNKLFFLPFSGKKLDPHIASNETAEKQITVEINIWSLNRIDFDNRHLQI